MLFVYFGGMEFGFGIYRRNSIVLLTCILYSRAVCFLYLISIYFPSPPAPPPGRFFHDSRPTRISRNYMFAVQKDARFSSLK